MKFFVFFLLVFSSLFLNCLEIITPITSQQINLHEIESSKWETLKKEKEDGIQTWKGIPLKQLLMPYVSYEKIVLTADDDYQVELKRDDILQYKSIIALAREQESLPYKNQLIIPEMREMFWIKNIQTITLISESVNPALQTVIIAENWLENFSQPHPITPFKNKSGYYFDQVARSILLFTEENYCVKAVDGVKHNLDYQKYLKNAVLSKNEDGYDLMSPDMPTGMWLKKVAYIRVYDRALIFTSQLQTWQEIEELMSLDFKPNRVKLDANLYDYEQMESINWKEYETIQFYY
ncbi:MAG: hypothetical protein SVM86_04790 [Candidatus Cloacimonadota bacterium]|nr:hypothetical protein [Candidatus Cloacimonadota bacterium]